MIYWPKGTPQPKKKAPALELLAVGNYINICGPHKSGVLHTWQCGDICDPDITLPEIDIPTTDHVFAEVGTYLESEGYEWKIVVGKGGARLHYSLCGAEPLAKVSKGEKRKITELCESSAPFGDGSAVRRQAADPAPSLHHITDALKGRPNDFETEDEFFEAIVCICGASEVAASEAERETVYKQVVLPWALGWPDNTPEYVRTKWDYAKRHGTRLGWSRLCQLLGYMPPDTFAEEITPEQQEAINAPTPDEVAERTARESMFANYAYVSDADYFFDLIPIPHQSDLTM
jgi:hypothetical protein